MSSIVTSRISTRSTPRSGLSRSASLSAAPVSYNSNIENAVVGAKLPLALPASAHRQAGQHAGQHLNRDEELSFRGPLPLSKYAINHDASPVLIKKASAPVRYTQQVSVRHLNPPTPAPHGDITIKEFQRQIPAAPPVVLRQPGRRAPTPPTLVYREAPPAPPARLPSQRIDVEGTPIPPPARKVVFEKLADEPAKPQNILIEKWLPFKARSRRVILERSNIAPPPNPKNVVIEWETPAAQIDQQCNDLGVVNADPEEYVRQHGCSLRQPHEIPNLCSNGSCGLARSASCNFTTASLCGDVDALRRVDLDAHGLSELRRFL
jgi:hypothetical protein